MKKIVIVIAGMSLLFGLAWGVEVAEMSPHMKAAVKAVKALKKQLEAKDAGAAKSAKDAALHFGHIKGMFERDGVASAAKFAQEAVDAANAVASKVSAGDFAGAGASAGELNGACKSCHTQHRTKDDAGNYGIK